MSLDDAVGALRACPVFRRIDDGRLKLIALTGETLRYRAGETLFARGDAGDAAYVVVSGAAEVRMDPAAAPVARLERGELFGEIAALCDRPRIAYVTAAAPMEVLRLEGGVLRRLLAEFGDLALELIRLMADRLETANLKLAARDPGGDAARTKP